MDDKPITVKIGGKEYTVIKNKDQMPELSLKHEDLTLQIEEQDVPAYRIDKLNYVLVALMDSKGKIRLYKFDSYKDNEKPAKYTLFRQFNSKELNVTYLDFPKKLIPKKSNEVLNLGLIFPNSTLVNPLLLFLSLPTLLFFFWPFLF